MKLPIRFLLFYAVTALITLLVLFTLARAQQNQQGVTQFYLVGSASTAAKVTGTAVLWPGGSGAFDCVGTWNGATVTLSMLASDGSTYLAEGTGAAGGVFTANALTNFTWGRGYIEGIVTAAGSSTALQCSVRPLFVAVQ